MKKLLKKILGERIISFYHYVVAILASVYYGFPSKKMVVIGVTGTKGKTSTINFMWAALMAGGHKTGVITTANVRIGNKEIINPYHMTMPGRFTIQKLLAQMVKEGCTHCIVETTSQGIKQYRHIGIAYDQAVFTNLTPEHLESHENSFEKYRNEKLKLFAALSSHEKILNGKRVPKAIIVNQDSKDAPYFLAHKADTKITYAIDGDADIVAKNIVEKNDGVTFTLNDHEFHIQILGRFNVYNVLPAIIVARLAGDKDESISLGLSSLKLIPGRMEEIKEGQSFMVIVDYAHEKESMTNVLRTAGAMRKNHAKIIVVLGAEGGGRDKAKRPLMAELAAHMADYVVVTNVDPYDDNPQIILEDIASVAEKFGKVRNENLFVILDRREGIHKALSLASGHDIVLVTGKGAEQSMIIGDQKIPWDDRVVVREELHKLSR